VASPAYAFLVALGLTVVGVPLLRRLALATNFVDRPAARKSHVQPVPYLGGVAIISSVLLAILVERRLPAKIGGIALGAALIGTMGLLDDDRTLSPRLRFLTEAGAAVLATLLGLRVHATGMAPVDVLLTVVWIVGITNAMNLLDNMDGLAAGVAAAAAGALFCLAGLAHQVTATVAAALAGACLGFLVYNRRPASVFMGDTGSLFLGFVLAVLTVDIDPALAPPASFAIPIILLSLPILDTSTVTLARLRRGRPVSEGGKDHLSHRLVALGLSPGQAVLVLIGVEAALGVLAVLAGRGVIPLIWAVAAVAGILVIVSMFTNRATVYPDPVIGVPRRTIVAASGAGLGLLLVAAPALVALARASGPAYLGTTSANHALASLGTATSQQVVVQLEEANRNFAQARSRLRSPLASMGLLLPGVSSNLRAARTLTDVGFDLTGNAIALTSLADAARLTIDLGTPPVGEVNRLSPLLANASAALDLSQQRLERARTQPYLVRALRRTADRLTARVREAQSEVDRAASLARLLPTLLGESGARRYLLAYQDARDLRPTGGSITSWGEIVADQGSLRLGEFDAGVGPWSTIDLSPDFPTAAGTIRDLYEQSTGHHLDGVVALDATGLGRLQDLTGVHTGPDAGAAAVRSVWDAALEKDLGTAAQVGRALSDASRTGHLLIALANADEQRLAAQFGVDGALPGGEEDSLLVVTETPAGQGAGGHLRRELSYQIQLDPKGQVATATGKLQMTFANTGPAATTEVSVLTPLSARSVTVDGKKVATASTEAFGRTVESASLDVPAGGARVLGVDLAGTVQLPPGGWYGLEVVRQPGLIPENVHVSVVVPNGWRIAERRGLQGDDERVAAATLTTDRRQTVWVRLERAGWSGLWRRLVHGR
jgi:UDP-GlcNAc:undecaprenyl-phosphate GlcNAc-1-phosphate transferase